MPAMRDLRVPSLFVLPAFEEGAYYLFGSTWRLPGCSPPSFHCYRSCDLETWEGPCPAFVRPEGFWADRDSFAPEVHEWGCAFYMFANFKAQGCFRGTQVPADEQVFLTVSALCSRLVLRPRPPNVTQRLPHSTSSGRARRQSQACRLPPGRPCQSVCRHGRASRPGRPYART